MEVLAYNPAQGAGHLMREFYLKGEEVKRSIERLIKGLIKVGARVSYHASRWLVHVASSRVLRGIPLAHHYPAAFGRRYARNITVDRGAEGGVCSTSEKRTGVVAQRVELESSVHFQRSVDAHGWVETHRRSSFRPRTTGICEIAE